LYVKKNGVSHIHPLEFPDSRNTPISKGIEDIRLFEYNGTVYGIGTTREYGPSYFKMVMFQLNDQYQVCNFDLIKGDFPQKDQKNWLPFLQVPNKLQLIYSFKPLGIYTVDNHTVTTSIPDDDTNDWRGSAGPIKVGNRILYLVHRKIAFVFRLIYQHCFFDIVSNEYSKPFYFENPLDIEFCIGMFYQDSRISLLYTHRDRHLKQIAINPHELTFYPQP
jgi:hypothetical protein